MRAAGAKPDPFDHNAFIKLMDRIRFRRVCQSPSADRAEKKIILRKVDDLMLHVIPFCPEAAGKRKFFGKGLPFQEFLVRVGRPPGYRKKRGCRLNGSPAGE